MSTQVSEYQFQFESSRAALLLSYAGAFGTALCACYLVVVAADRQGAQMIGLLASAVVLVLASLFVLRRTYVQATRLCVGTAGVFVRSLLTERFVAWKQVVQIASTPPRLRVVFRDGGQPTEVWVTVPDETLAKRVETYATRFVDAPSRT